FFSSLPPAYPPTPSFPTRRSSDLPRRRLAGDGAFLRAGEEERRPAAGLDEGRLCPSDYQEPGGSARRRRPRFRQAAGGNRAGASDRKSTRLNSSHLGISYAVFCLK